MTSLTIVCEGSCDTQEKTVNAQNDVVFRNEAGDLEVSDCPTCDGKAHIKGEEEQTTSEDNSDQENTTEVSLDVESRQDLEELSWEDLKEVAGEYGIKRNQTREEITSELITAMGLE